MGRSEKFLDSSLLNASENINERLKAPMKIVAYVVTLLIAVLPIANIFQASICGMASRLFIAKEKRTIAFFTWPWPLKILSFITAFAFWFGINKIWLILFGYQMPIVLSGVVYLAIALFAKRNQNEMNFIFRANKTNEIYATLILFVYLLFFTKETVIL